MFKGFFSRFYARYATLFVAGGGLLLISGCDDSDTQIAYQIIDTVLAALSIVFTWVG